MLHPKLNFHRLFVFQSLGFAILIAFIWVDSGILLPAGRYLSPQALFWVHAALETAWIGILAVFILALQICAMKRIHLLEGLFPICSFCKKVREDGNWIPIDEYVRDHTDADFSHGFCPQCGIKNYGEFLGSESEPEMALSLSSTAAK